VVVGISAFLCWIVEFGTGIMIWQLKDAPFCQLFFSSIPNVIAIAMESAFHNIKTLDLMIRVISVFALIGYGAFLLDALEYMELMPSTFGKGAAASVISDIRPKISELNILFCILFFIYLFPDRLLDCLIFQGVQGQIPKIY